MLFVPPELTTIAKMIERGDVPHIVPEAERLASLGSTGAKAFLAYLEMTGMVSGVPRYDRAQLFAIESAQSGNSFGHYVLGWIRLAQARRAEAFKHMFEAAKQLFLPAIVDVGRFIAMGVGVKQADVLAAERALLQAHGLGHRGALVFLMKLYRTGARGPGHRILGVIGYPYAAIRRTIFASRTPFSEKVFAYSSSVASKIAALNGSM